MPDQHATSHARRLASFQVVGLFGLFDHRIELRLQERITIIYAPNGYGKTILLRMIASFFGGSLLIYRNVEFQEVIIDLSDGAKIKIIPRLSLSNLPDIGDNAPPKTYTIHLEHEGITEEWSPWDKKNGVNIRQVPLSSIERYVPFLDRLSAREWRDSRTNEILSLDEALERSSEYLPPHLLRPSNQPEWLTSIRNSVHCRLIETQRLLVVDSRREQRAADTAANMTPAVRTYSGSLAAQIGDVLADSGTIGQSLDRTFPHRFLARLGGQSEPLSEVTLNQRLSELEELRTRLTNVGLLDPTEDAAVVSSQDFTLVIRHFLTEYLDDNWKKLAVYVPLLSKLELFVHLINNRFRFKTIAIDRKEGYVFHDIRERKLAPESLSSGEQHELVLIYELLFQTRKDTLILIDEPEISLHIAWQKQVLSDLRRIIELSPMDILISTHSPQIIGSNLDIAIGLSGPTISKS